MPQMTRAGGNADQHPDDEPTARLHTAGSGLLGTGSGVGRWGNHTQALIAGLPGRTGGLASFRSSSGAKHAGFLRVARTREFFLT